MDPLDGMPVERTSKTIRSIRHLLAAAQKMGRRRDMGAHLARSARKTVSKREASYGRDDGGRKLRSRKKGGEKVGKTKKGKGTKWMLATDKRGTPLGAYLDAASPAEVTLVEKTLEHTPHAKHMKRFVADRGYDSNSLREFLLNRNILPIIPKRSNNTKAMCQDGRNLRRYAHRWTVERTFAWLGWFRRLLVRHERLITTYRGFFHFACALLAIRVLLK